MKSLFLACAGLALAGFCSVAEAQSSRLKSLATENDARGWEAVGRLDMGGGFCTATLIAPDLVLSAAHCVYDRSGLARGADEITFRAGLRNGAAAAERKVVQYAAHPDYDPNRRLDARNVVHDVALLKLAEPIAFSEIDPFVLHGDVVRPGPVSVVSYGQGRSELQSRQRECGLLERQNDLLMFDCNVTFGSSGAPVFSHMNGRGRIVSVISGGAVDHNGQKVAVGPHLPSVVADLKRDLRALESGPVARVRRIGAGDSGGTSAKFVKVN